MASLFDNRYEYDTIYPRGRSGETLRAVDTQDNHRPVVVKRPAPQDAPPLRAAQEVSIIAEKKALERLTGHPVLTELRASGTFRAGGQSYTYIVMDRAKGEIIEDLVLDRRTPPELERLIIVDGLLDLLIKAHSQHVIYNDVDAKHLFWDQVAYQLKVIDWGNAILTDDAKYDGKITHANDIYQVGELLYFLYQGGARLRSETDADGQNYTVLFEQETPATIQEIITKATHPNVKSQRYATMRQLRDALTKYRTPIEQQRNQIVQNVQSEFNADASKQMLQAWQAELQTALDQDAGYPPARALQNDIRLQLQYIAVQADFDAARIYLETGNWERAIHLIEELIPNADEYTAKALRFLVNAAEQLQRSGKATPPDEFDAAIDQILSNRIPAAVARLFAIAQHTPNYEQDIMLMLAHLANLMPERVIVLRPHLVRAGSDLAKTLDAPLPDGITPIIDRYSKFAIQLSDLDTDHPQSIEYAENATRQLLSQWKHVQSVAYANPEDARQALAIIRSIDPLTQHIQAVDAYLDTLQTVVQTLNNFRPAPDGADIQTWAWQQHQNLAPHHADLTDPAFHAVSNALAIVSQAWQQAANDLILGRKRQTVATYNNAASAIEPYNQAVAAWLTKSANLIQDAPIVEKFAPNQAIADNLLQGYQAWDRGQAGKAAEFARRSVNQAKTEGETAASERLQALAELTSQWLNQDGVHDQQLTIAIEKSIFGLLLPDEQAEYDEFAGQMPSESLYLKAMKRGIVNVLRESSSAGYRALFAHYILRGILEIQDNELDTADFWREAALNTIPEGKTHPLFTAFDGELTRRRLIIRAEQAILAIQTPADIPNAKQVLNAPLADQWLKDAQQAMLRYEDALTAWADGDYRAARTYLQEAIMLVDTVNDAGEMDITPFREWLEPYLMRAEELVERRQLVQQAAMTGDLKPDPAVLRAFEQMIEISEMTLGADYVRQPTIWRDLYVQMVTTHTNYNMTKREKLDEFSVNFSALFLDKHPTYRLFQRWEEAARQLPDDVDEELTIDVTDIDTTTERPVFEDSQDIVTTSIPEDDDQEQDETTPPDFEDDNEIIKPRRPAHQDDASSRSGRSGRVLLWGALLLLLAGVGGLFALQMMGSSDSDNDLPADPPTQISAVDRTATATALGIIPATDRPTRTPTDPPTRTPTPTQTDIPPETNTPTPTEDIPTIAPTLTPSPIVTIVTNTPPPTLPPTQTFTPAPVSPNAEDVVSLLSILDILPTDQYVWDPTFFSQGAGGVWQLGASVETAGTAPITITLDNDFLNAVETNLTTRLQRIEVDMALVLFDDNRLSNDQVFFGVALENTARQRYGTQVVLRSASVVSLGINENGNFRTISQLPLSPIEVTLAIERTADGSLGFFINGQQLGDSPALFAQDENLNLVLYNAGGGMFVNVSAIRLELAP